MLRSIVVGSILAASVVVGINSSSSAAQEDTCPVIVERALQTTDSACGGIGRNQACYGNFRVEAQPHEGVQTPILQTVGDVASLNDIRRLDLTGMDTVSGAWGVALLRIQASLPDTLPGQNVTMLIFGDVQFENPESSPPEVMVTATGNINVRSRPTTQAENVIASLASGQNVMAVGRNADASWLRVRLDAEQYGWVFANLVTGEGFDTLLVAAEEDSQTGSGLQAFYFSAGIGDSPCMEAPDSGILVQTPAGFEQINFALNGVEISMGSTVYFYLQSDDANQPQLGIDVYEGSAQVTAQTESVYVPAGASTSVTLTEDLREPAAPPQPPAPLAPSEAINTFISAEQTVIIEAVTPAAPLSEEEIAAFQSATVYIPGSQGWVDTGLVVEAGQIISISASGSANQCGAPNPNCTGNPDIDRMVGPDGNSAYEQCAGQFGPCLITGLYGALVARVGDGSPVLVGSGATFTADVSGTVYLGFNDHRYDDNTGGYSAVITVRPAGE